jgi:hypothetical protein
MTERAPDCRVAAEWSGFLLFIGAGAFAIGMGIHNETLAQQQPPRPEPIYYCATGQEFPAFEPCKDRKARWISDGCLKSNLSRDGRRQPSGTVSRWLRRDRSCFWNVLTLRPGPSPLRALAAAFNPPAENEGAAGYETKIS